MTPEENWSLVEYDIAIAQYHQEQGNASEDDLKVLRFFGLDKDEHDEQ